MQIIHSAIVLCWSYYCHGADQVNIPEFSFVNQGGSRKANDDLGWTDDKIKPWNAKLEQYGYARSDDLDLVVGSAIEQGYIDVDLMLQLCRQKQKEVDVANASVKWNDAWNLYHGSFDSNEGDIAKAFEEGMRDVAQYSSASQYSQGVKILRKVDRNDLADQLIEFLLR